MKKYLGLLLAALVIWSVPAFAGIEVKEDGTTEGEAVKINLGSDLEGTFSTGDTYNVTLEGTLDRTAYNATGNMTFQTNVIASGRIAASSSIPSSSNGINPSTLPYSLLLKSIGNVAGETATLPAGKDGQVLKIQVVGCGPAGTWIVSRLKGSGWTTMTFNARGDEAYLLYDATLGWIILSSTSVTVADTAL